MSIPYKAQLQPILRLAVPTMLESFLLSIVGVVDTFFVAKLGLAEVTAVGVATTIIQIYIAVFLALGTAATILVSRSIGEERYENVKRTIAQAIYITGIVGLIVGILSFFCAKPLLLLMGTSANALEGALTYFRIVATASIAISLFTVLGSVLRAAGDTKSPLKAGLWMNAIHLVLDYVFIFGFWVIPGLGIMGAAVATVLARAIGVCLLFFYLNKKQSIMPKGLSYWKWHVSIQKKMVRLGFPAAMERLFKRTGQILYFGMIIRMGTLVFAAHKIAGNFTIFTDVVGAGLSTAAVTLIGQQLGRKEEKAAKSYAMTATILTVCSMTGVLFVIFLFIKLGASLFTNNTFVIQQIAWVIGIDVLTQPATAVVLILTAALQAGGDTKFPMYLTGIGIWLFRTGGVYVFGVYLGWGLPGVWFAILLDNYFRAAVLFWRYRKRWMD